MSGYHDRGDGGNYDHSHRALLQAFMSRSVMTFDEMKPIVAEILTAHEPDRTRLANDITQPIVTSMVQAVNAKIGALDFEIRSAINQNDRTLTYALVNTTSDALTQIATTFSPDEIAYIKRLLDCMFETNNKNIREVMAVKHMTATQLAKIPRNRQSQAAADSDGEGESNAQAESTVKGITINDADKVLQHLEVEAFFQRSPQNYYSLAPRALMELRAWLKETYNDPPAEDEDDHEPTIRIRDCEGCREIVTMGLRCDNKECGVRWHDFCAVQYFRGQQGSAKKCPKCKNNWDGSTFVGERADETGSRRRTTNGRSQLMNEEDE
ncbi:hypothetical protein P280DRAFT_476738 [Massarina eburnea CBS 473.64]|uniref:Non-structural maintenance of chromosomes element 1 homolog n=1 Tax=Massarina eburnea CBS 473.64 TaxID=1395130 RepID=A0A6A6SAE1_9PLEO|nr:hypothetical protein P280DRAFT_476738 [Massarina eburnea CBS 473.64]